MLAHLRNEIASVGKAILTSGDRGTEILKFMAANKATDTALVFASNLAQDPSYLQLEAEGNQETILNYVTKKAGSYQPSDEELALVVNALNATAPKKSSSAARSVPCGFQRQ
jgi:hypothetical protein